jgi:hypothetical protein
METQEIGSLGGPVGGGALKSKEQQLPQPQPQPPQTQLNNINRKLNGFLNLKTPLIG